MADEAQVLQPKDSNETVANPFAQLHLSSTDALRDTPRVKCEGCGKSRRYWCGSCGVLCISAGAPSPVQLPIRFEVLQAARETAQKSTAGQAVALAPDSVRVWRDRTSFINTILAGDGADVALLYPRDEAVPLSEAANVRTLVVIDAPWTSAALMAAEPPFSNMQCVKLTTQGRQSAFWRYPPLRGEASAFNRQAVEQCLSTVEAIHQAAVEVNGEAGTRGDYDDILWLFAFQHATVQRALGPPDSVLRKRIFRKSKGVLKRFDGMPEE